MIDSMRYTTQSKASLLEHLLLMAPDSSKSTLRSWLKSGRIFVDDVCTKHSNTEVYKGSCIRLGKQLEKPLAEGVEILYQDDHLIVINKPQGLLSVETPREKNRTAHNILKKEFYPRRIFPVHRLDQDTSGIMVFVSSQLAFDSLKQQFKNHSIERNYIAQVQGHITPSSGTIDTHLKEDSNFKMHVCKKEGVRAITHYKTVKKHRKTSLVKLQLETGKKNQIRAHLAYLGHPIVGDLKYGNERFKHSRLMLHAQGLHFFHPKLNKTMHFQKEENFSSYAPTLSRPLE